MILSIDTTNAHGSIALALHDEPIDEMPLHAPDGYSEILFAAIAELLARNNVTIGQIELFAAASGPGTFTGVRVGLACAKGLAEALAKPIAAVSNLEALASLGSAALRAVTLDARRNEVYAALYDSTGEAIIPECLTTLEAFRAVVPRDAEWVAYDGPLSAPIARIAARRLLTGNVSDPAAVEANYIRRSDAELHLNVRSSSPPHK